MRDMMLCNYLLYSKPGLYKYLFHYFLSDLHLIFHCIIFNFMILDLHSELKNIFTLY